MNFSCQALRCGVFQEGIQIRPFQCYSLALNSLPSFWINKNINSRTFLKLC